jgi:tetratricopeptide (TPR) repeat protein
LNNLGVLYTNNGKYEEAIQTIEQGLKLDPSNTALQKNLENAKTKQKAVQARDTKIAEIQKQADARPNDPEAAYRVARAYASFDLKEEALEWLGKAVQRGFNDLRFAKEDPLMAELRKDPRFARLLEGR